MGHDAIVAVVAVILAAGATFALRLTFNRRTNVRGDRNIWKIIRVFGWRNTTAMGDIRPAKDETSGDH